MITIGFLPWWPQNPYQILLKRELNANGLRVVGNPPLSIIRLLLGRDGLDVVHVHWPQGLYMHRIWRYPYVILILLLYRILKNNVVWTVHELEAYESTHTRLDAFLRNRLFAWSRALIVHGRFTEQEVRTEHRYPGPICVAMHPTYAGWYRDDIDAASARARLGLPADGRIFLFFGYIKPYKGVEDLVAAFQLLNVPTARLVIAGKPLDSRIEQSIAELAAPDPRIHCHMRYISDDDVQVYFRACDVVVLPFRRTQTSGSLLLALSFGKPIIAPAVATIPEYVDSEIAELFDPDRLGSLASALRAICERNLSRMEICARKRVLDLSWPRFAKAHMDAYRHALPAGAK